MTYSHIYIIGAGKVTKECQKIASDFFKQEVIFVKNIENDDFCKNLKNCLIISANNSYIFKKECVQNNTIINYHNALLPFHKGCNARIGTYGKMIKKQALLGTWLKKVSIRVRF